MRISLILLSLLALRFFLSPPEKPVRAEGPVPNAAICLEKDPGYKTLYFQFADPVFCYFEHPQRAMAFARRNKSPVFLFFDSITVCSRGRYLRNMQTEHIYRMLKWYFTPLFLDNSDYRLLAKNEAHKSSYPEEKRVGDYVLRKSLENEFNSAPVFLILDEEGNEVDRAFFSEVYKANAFLSFLKRGLSAWQRGERNGYHWDFSDFPGIQENP